MPTTTKDLDSGSYTIVHDIEQDTADFVSGLSKMGFRVKRASLTKARFANIDKVNPVPSFLEWVDKNLPESQKQPIVVVHQVDLGVGVIVFALQDGNGNLM